MGIKYPVEFKLLPGQDYIYQFQFDLIYGGAEPMHQIPHLRDTVNDWLVGAGIDYTYRHGLIWLLKNEQDAMLFRLRFA